MGGLRERALCVLKVRHELCIHVTMVVGPALQLHLCRVAWHQKSFMLSENYRGHLRFLSTMLLPEK